MPKGARLVPLTGWCSVGEDRDSAGAFLFTWPSGGGDAGRSRPTKLPKARRLGEQCSGLVGADVATRTHPNPRAVQVGGSAQAVIRDQSGCGIYFGPDGLAIPLAAAATPGSQAARCKLGPYYARMPDGGKSLFAAGDGGGGRGGGGAAQLTRLRVYVAQGGGEEWELQGIVWQTRRRDLE